jgi:hypothetical protein
MEEKMSSSVNAADSADLKQEMTSQVSPAENHSDSSSHTAADDPDRKLEVVQQSPKNDDRKYLTGIKLTMVVTAVTLVCFLVLLDTSIIVTVGVSCLVPYTLLTRRRQFP